MAQYVALLFLAAQVQNTPNEMLSLARSAQLDNHRRMQRLTLKYATENYRAENLISGLAGQELNPSPILRTGQTTHFLLDRGKFIVRQRVNEPAPKPNIKESPKSFPGSPGLYAGKSESFANWDCYWNGEQTVFRGNSANGKPPSIGIRAPGRPVNDLYLFFGCWGFENCREAVDEILAMIAQPGTHIRTRNEMFDSVACIVFEAQSANAERSLELWVAPNQRYATRKIVRKSKAGGSDTVMEYTDLRLQGDFWFPWRHVQVDCIKTNTIGGIFEVWETKVAALDFDSQPDFESNFFTAPAGSEVADYDDRPKFYKTSKEEKIRFDDLPRLYDLTQETHRLREVGALPPEPVLAARKPRLYWLILLPAAGVGWLVLRHFRKNP
jgi:hypothetical protein